MSRVKRIPFWVIAQYWGRSWMPAIHQALDLVFVALGVAYTAGSKYVNVFLLRWTYSQWMPTMGGLGVVPLL